MKVDAEKDKPEVLIAMEATSDLAALDTLWSACRVRIRPVAAPAQAIRQALLRIAAAN